MKPPLTRHSTPRQWSNLRRIIRVTRLRQTVQPNAFFPLPIIQETFSIRTSGKGTTEITGEVQEILRRCDLQTGIVSIFIQHTSCSLVIMENADPSARRDLEVFMDDLVPDDYPKFIHTYEGPDDMPSHIKMALTRTTEVIPFSNRRLCLGTWQGIFLWEHRVQPHTRRIIVSLNGE